MSAGVLVLTGLLELCSAYVPSLSPKFPLTLTHTSQDPFLIEEERGQAPLEP